MNKLDILKDFIDNDILKDSAEAERIINLATGRIPYNTRAISDAHQRRDNISKRKIDWAKEQIDKIGDPSNDDTLKMVKYLVDVAEKRCNDNIKVIERNQTRALHGLTPGSLDYISEKDRGDRYLYQAIDRLQSVYSYLEGLGIAVDSSVGDAKTTAELDKQWKTAMLKREQEMRKLLEDAKRIERKISAAKKEVDADVSSDDIDKLNEFSRTFGMYGDMPFEHLSRSSSREYRIDKLFEGGNAPGARTSLNPQGRQTRSSNVYGGDFIKTVSERLKTLQGNMKNAGKKKVASIESSGDKAAAKKTKEAYLASVNELDRIIKLVNGGGGIYDRGDVASQKRRNALQKRIQVLTSKFEREVASLEEEGGKYFGNTGYSKSAPTTSSSGSHITSNGGRYTVAGSGVSDVSAGEAKLEYIMRGTEKNLKTLNAWKAKVRDSWKSAESKGAQITYKGKRYNPEDVHAFDTETLNRAINGKIYTFGHATGTGSVQNYNMLYDEGEKFIKAYAEIISEQASNNPAREGILKDLRIDLKRKKAKGKTSEEIATKLLERVKRDQEFRKKFISWREMGDMITSSPLVVGQNIKEFDLKQIEQYINYVTEGEEASVIKEAQKLKTSIRQKITSGYDTYLDYSGTKGGSRDLTHQAMLYAGRVNFAKEAHDSGADALGSIGVTRGQLSYGTVLDEYVEELKDQALKLGKSKNVTEKEAYEFAYRQAGLSVSDSGYLADKMPAKQASKLRGKIRSKNKSVEGFLDSLPDTHSMREARLSEMRRANGTSLARANSEKTLKDSALELVKVAEENGRQVVYDTRVKNDEVYVDLYLVRNDKWEELSDREKKDYTKLSALGDDEEGGTIHMTLRGADEYGRLKRGSDASYVEFMPDTRGHGWTDTLTHSWGVATGYLKKYLTGALKEEGKEFTDAEFGRRLTGLGKSVLGSTFVDFNGAPIYDEDRRDDELVTEAQRRANKFSARYDTVASEFFREFGDKIVEIKRGSKNVNYKGAKVIHPYKLDPADAKMFRELYVPLVNSGEVGKVFLDLYGQDFLDQLKEIQGFNSWYNNVRASHKSGVRIDPTGKSNKSFSDSGKAHVGSIAAISSPFRAVSGTLADENIKKGLASGDSVKTASLEKLVEKGWTPNYLVLRDRERFKKIIEEKGIEAIPEAAFDTSTSEEAMLRYMSISPALYEEAIKRTREQLIKAKKMTDQDFITGSLYDTDSFMVKDGLIDTLDIIGNDKTLQFSLKDLKDDPEFLKWLGFEDYDKKKHGKTEKSIYKYLQDSLDSDTGSTDLIGGPLSTDLFGFRAGDKLKSLKLNKDGLEIRASRVKHAVQSTKAVLGSGIRASIQMPFMGVEGGQKALWENLLQVVAEEKEIDIAKLRNMNFQGVVGDDSKTLENIRKQVPYIEGRYQAYLDAYARSGGASPDSEDYWNSYQEAIGILRANSELQFLGEFLHYASANDLVTDTDNNIWVDNDNKNKSPRKLFGDDPEKAKQYYKLINSIGTFDKVADVLFPGDSNKELRAILSMARMYSTNIKKETINYGGVGAGSNIDPEKEKYRDEGGMRSSLRYLTYTSQWLKQLKGKSRGNGKVYGDSDFAENFTNQAKARSDSADRARRYWNTANEALKNIQSNGQLGLSEEVDALEEYQLIFGNENDQKLGKNVIDISSYMLNPKSDEGELTPEEAENFYAQAIFKTLGEKDLSKVRFTLSGLGNKRAQDVLSAMGLSGATVPFLGFSGMSPNGMYSVTPNLRYIGGLLNYINENVQSGDEIDVKSLRDTRDEFMRLLKVEVDKDSDKYAEAFKPLISSSFTAKTNPQFNPGTVNAGIEDGFNYAGTDVLRDALSIASGASNEDKLSIIRNNARIYKYLSEKNGISGGELLEKYAEIADKNISELSVQGGDLYETNLDAINQELVDALSNFIEDNALALPTALIRNPLLDTVQAMPTLMKFTKNVGPYGISTALGRNIHENADFDGDQIQGHIITNLKYAIDEGNKYTEQSYEDWKAAEEEAYDVANLGKAIDDEILSESEKVKKFTDNNGPAKPKVNMTEENAKFFVDKAKQLELAYISRTYQVETGRNDYIAGTSKEAVGAFEDYLKNGGKTQKRNTMIGTEMIDGIPLDLYMAKVMAPFITDALIQNPISAKKMVEKAQENKNIINPTILANAFQAYPGGISEWGDEFDDLRGSKKVISYLTYLKKTDEESFNALVRNGLLETDGENNPIMMLSKKAFGSAGRGLTAASRFVTSNPDRLEAYKEKGAKLLLGQTSLRLGGGAFGEYVESPQEKASRVSAERAMNKSLDAEGKIVDKNSASVDAHNESVSESIKLEGEKTVVAGKNAEAISKEGAAFAAEADTLRESEQIVSELSKTKLGLVIDTKTQQGINALFDSISVLKDEAGAPISFEFIDGKVGLDTGTHEYIGGDGIEKVNYTKTNGSGTSENDAIFTTATSLERLINQNRADYPETEALRAIVERVGTGDFDFKARESALKKDFEAKGFSEKAGYEQLAKTGNVYFGDFIHAVRDVAAKSGLKMADLANIENWDSLKSAAKNTGNAGVDKAIESGEQQLEYLARVFGNRDEANRRATELFTRNKEFFGALAGRKIEFIPGASEFSSILKTGFQFTGTDGNVHKAYTNIGMTADQIMYDTATGVPVLFDTKTFDTDKGHGIQLGLNAYAIQNNPALRKVIEDFIETSDLIDDARREEFKSQFKNMSIQDIKTFIASITPDSSVATQFSNIGSFGEGDLGTELNIAKAISLMLGGGADLSMIPDSLKGLSLKFGDRIIGQDAITARRIKLEKSGIDFSDLAEKYVNYKEDSNNQAQLQTAFALSKGIDLTDPSTTTSSIIESANQVVIAADNAGENVDEALVELAKQLILSSKKLSDSTSAIKKILGVADISDIREDDFVNVLGDYYTTAKANRTLSDEKAGNGKQKNPEYSFDDYTEALRNKAEAERRIKDYQSAKPGSKAEEKRKELEDVIKRSKEYIDKYETPYDPVNNGPAKPEDKNKAYRKGVQSGKEKDEIDKLLKRDEELYGISEKASRLGYTGNKSDISSDFIDFLNKQEEYYNILEKQEKIKTELNSDVAKNDVGYQLKLTEELKNLAIAAIEAKEAMEGAKESYKEFDELHGTSSSAKAQQNAIAKSRGAEHDTRMNSIINSGNISGDSLMGSYKSIYSSISSLDQEAAIIRAGSNGRISPEVAQANARRLQAIERQKEALLKSAPSLKAEKSGNDGKMKYYINGKEITKEQYDELNEARISGADKAAIAEQKYAAQVQKTGTATQRLSENLKQRFTSMIEYSVVNRAVGMITQGLTTVINLTEELDKKVVDLQIAIGGTRDDTIGLLTSYESMAAKLGTTLSAVADAANSWYRSGFRGSDAEALTEASIKLSKLGGIDTSSATSYLVSILKGWKLEATEMEDIVSKLTAIDMSAAISSGELAEAMSRASNSAKLAGSDMNNYIGYITTVTDVTQKSASSVGESFKTIYSRLANVKAGKFAATYNDMQSESYSADDYEALNDIEVVLNRVGIKLRSTATTWRDADDVFAEIGSKWKGFDQTTQNAIATAMAGTRQRENVLTLFQNWDSTSRYAQIAENSYGTAETKMKAYTDSVEAAKNRVTEAVQELSASLLNTAGILKTFYNAVADIIKNIAVVGGFLAAFGVAKSIGKAGGVKNYTNSLFNRLSAGNYALGYRGISSIVRPNIERNRTDTWSDQVRLGVMDAYGTSLRNSLSMPGKGYTSNQVGFGVDLQSALFSSFASNREYNARNFLSNLVANEKFSNSDLVAPLINREVDRLLLSASTNNLLSANEKEIAATGKLTEKKQLLTKLLDENGDSVKESLSSLSDMSKSFSELSNISGYRQTAIKYSDLLGYGAGAITGLGVQAGFDNGALTTVASTAAQLSVSTMLKSYGQSGLAGLLGGGLGTLGMIGSAASLAMMIWGAVRASDKAKIQKDVDKANETKEKYTNATSAISLASKLDEYRYGVNEYGKNVSLSDSDYADFLSASNELANIFPDLVMYTDAEGNAIVNLNGSLKDGSAGVTTFSERIDSLLSTLQKDADAAALTENAYNESVNTAKEDLLNLDTPLNINALIDKEGFIKSIGESIGSDLYLNSIGEKSAQAILTNPDYRFIIKDAENNDEAMSLLRNYWTGYNAAVVKASQQMRDEVLAMGRDTGQTDKFQNIGGATEAAWLNILSNTPMIESVDDLRSYVEKAGEFTSLLSEDFFKVMAGDTGEFTAEDISNIRQQGIDTVITKMINNGGGIDELEQAYLKALGLDWEGGSLASNAASNVRSNSAWQKFISRYNVSDSADVYAQLGERFTKEKLDEWGVGSMDVESARRLYENKYINSSMSAEQVASAIKADILPNTVTGSIDRMNYYRNVNANDIKNLVDGTMHTGNGILGLKDLQEENDNIIKSLSAYPSSIKEAGLAYAKSVREAAGSQEKLAEANEAFEASIKSFQDSTKVLVAQNYLKKYFNDIDESANGTIDTLSEFASVWKKLDSVNSSYKSALSEQNENGTVSQETYLSLISDNIENAKMFEVTNGRIKVSESGRKGLYKDMAEASIAEGQAKLLSLDSSISSVGEDIDMLKAMLESNPNSPNASTASTQLASLEESKAKLESEQAAVQASIDAAQKIVDADGAIVFFQDFNAEINKIDTTGDGVINTLEEVANAFSSITSAVQKFKEVSVEQNQMGHVSADSYLNYAVSNPELASQLFTVSNGRAMLRPEFTGAEGQRNGEKLVAQNILDTVIEDTENTIVSNQKLINQEKQKTENQDLELISNLEEQNDGLKTTLSLVKAINAEGLLTDNWADISNQFDTIKSNYDMLKSAKEEQASKGSLSKQTVAKILETNPAYANTVLQHNDATGETTLADNYLEEMWKVQRDELAKLYKQKIEDLEVTIAGNEAQIAAIDALLKGTDAATSEMAKFQNITVAGAALATDALMREAAAIQSIAKLQELESNNPAEAANFNIADEAAKIYDEITAATSEARAEMLNDSLDIYTEGTKGLSDEKKKELEITRKALEEENANLKEQVKIAKDNLDDIMNQTYDPNMWKDYLTDDGSGSYTDLDKINARLELIKKEIVMMEALDKGYRSVIDTAEYMDENYYKNRKKLLKEKADLLLQKSAAYKGSDDEKALQYQKEYLDTILEIRNLDDERIQDNIELLSIGDRHSSYLLSEYEALIATADSEKERLEYAQQITDELKKQFDLARSMNENEQSWIKSKLKYNTGGNTMYKMLIDLQKDKLEEDASAIDTIWEKTFNQSMEAYAGQKDAELQAARDADAAYAQYVSNYYSDYEAMGDLLLSKFKDQIKASQDALSTLEGQKPKEWTTTQQINTYYGDAAKYYNDIIAKAKDTLANVKYMTDEQIEDTVNTMNDAFAKLHENDIARIEETKALQEERYSAINDTVNEYISNLQKQKEVMEDYYDTEIKKLQDKETSIERTNKLIELQKNLLDATREKERVYVAGVGYTYQSNRSKVKEATKALDEYNLSDQINDLQNAKDREGELLDQSVKNWQDYLSMIEYQYGEYERIENHRMLAELLGVTTEEQVRDKLMTDMTSYQSFVKTQTQSFNVDMETLYGGFTSTFESFLNDYKGLLEMLTSLNRQYIQQVSASNYTGNNVTPNAGENGGESGWGPNYDKSNKAMAVDTSGGDGYFYSSSGWQYDDGKWWYALDNKHQYYASGWQKIPENDRWFYFDDEGYIIDPDTDDYPENGSDAWNGYTDEQRNAHFNIGGYASGIENGPVTYTGLAMLHGTASSPEYILNSDQAYNLLRYMSTSKPGVSSALGASETIYKFGDIVMNGVNDPEEFWRELSLAMGRRSGL